MTGGRGGPGGLVRRQIRPVSSSMPRVAAISNAMTSVDTAATSIMAAA
jgi:hypothetical protein